LIVKASDTELEHISQPTGKTIGEPNQGWVIDNFKSNRLGTIYFPAKGFYDIELEVMPKEKEEFKFQWIWIF
jgi:alpha-L-fucosidase